MKTTLLLWGSFLLSVLQLHAQSNAQAVINTTGHSYVGGYYQIDWSVGELALVTEMKSGNGQYMITNGFLQASDGAAARPDLRFSDDEIRVLPNFTDDKVEVHLLTPQQGKVSLLVYDVLGKEVLRKSLTGYGSGQAEQLSLRPLAAGTYFLKIDLVPAPGSVPKTGSYKIVKF